MNDPLQFVADSAMASEIALAVLLQSIARNSPAILKDFKVELDRKLQTMDIPTPGAQKNLAQIAMHAQNLLGG